MQAYTAMDAVADLGGFVRVRTNPPIFQVINLLLATFPLLRSVFSASADFIIVSREIAAEEAAASSFLSSLKLLEKLARGTKSQNYLQTTVQQTRNNAHRTQPHPAADVLVVCWCNGRDHH